MASVKKWVLRLEDTSEELPIVYLSSLFGENERHAKQRSRFSRSEGLKWFTGRTCDSEFEFRRDEMRPMLTICDGVGQNIRPVLVRFSWAAADPTPLGQ